MTAGALRCSTYMDEGGRDRTTGGRAGTGLGRAVPGPARAPPHRDEFVPKNLEFKEKLEQVMHMRDTAEELVLAAHEDNKLAQKLQPSDPRPTPILLPHIETEAE